MPARVAVVGGDQLVAPPVGDAPSGRGAHVTSLTASARIGEPRPAAARRAGVRRWRRAADDPVLGGDLRRRGRGVWAYTSAGPLTFVRAPIEVASIQGDTAVLSEGPAPGTEVVTVGGEELLGTEFAIEGE